MKRNISMLPIASFSYQTQLIQLSKTLKLEKFITSHLWQSVFLKPNAWYGESFLFSLIYITTMFLCWNLSTKSVLCYFIFSCHGLVSTEFKKFFILFNISFTLKTWCDFNFQFLRTLPCGRTKHESLQFLFVIEKITLNPMCLRY